MTQISRVRKPPPLGWTSSLGIFGFCAAMGFLETGFSNAGPLPGFIFQALVGLAFGLFGYGLVISSQWLLDGPQIWVFDDDGYRHSRQSKLWPVVRCVPYADMTRIHVTRLPDQSDAFALTLGLRSGKTIQINVSWTEAELGEIRDLLARRMPGSSLPLPT